MSSKLSHWDILGLKVVIHYDGNILGLKVFLSAWEFSTYGRCPSGRHEQRLRGGGGRWFTFTASAEDSSLLAKLSLGPGLAVFIHSPGQILSSL